MERRQTGAGRRRSGAGRRGRRVGMVVSAVALLSGAPGFGVSGQAWAAGAPCNTGTQTTSGTTITCTYASTGVEQTFSVPPGVTSVMVDVIGASGGVGGASGGGGIGGRGDDVSAALALSPGVSTLYVDVGGRGVNGGGGGFNGGGLQPIRKVVVMVK